MAKYLIITGASKGIGKAIAQVFLANQWQVINISRHACTLQNILNFPIDLSINNWEETLKQEIIPLISNAVQICLVHNAAKYEKDSIKTIDLNEYRSTLEVNLTAPIILNQNLIPHMKKNSSILYIGSTLSEKAVPNAASYAICKHALLGMMRATCQDLFATGIHTCCICPGFTDTDMLQQHLKHDPRIIQMVTRNVSEQRLIRPEEIAEVAWFCANNPVINGTVLHANLGQREG